MFSTKKHIASSLEYSTVLAKFANTKARKVSF